MPRYQQLIYEPVGGRADSSYNHYLDKYCRHQAERARSAAALPTPSLSPERESLHGAALPGPPCHRPEGLSGPTFAAWPPAQKERERWVSDQVESMKWASDQVEGAREMSLGNIPGSSGGKRGHKGRTKLGKLPRTMAPARTPVWHVGDPDCHLGPLHSSP